MKGATEVPTTITVIIIQYTLIKRMKCELAFPISPTYSLNVKYSSHGLPPWKHRGTVGISRTATTVLLRERRSGESFGESKWHGATQLLPQKPAQALRDTEPWCCPLPPTLCPSLVSFLTQGRDPLQPQGFSALNAPREWALLGWKKCVRLAWLNEWNQANLHPLLDMLKCLLSPFSPGKCTVFDFIFLTNTRSNEVISPVFLSMFQQHLGQSTAGIRGQFPHGGSCHRCRLNRIWLRAVCRSEPNSLNSFWTQHQTEADNSGSPSNPAYCHTPERALLLPRQTLLEEDFAVQPRRFDSNQKQAKPCSTPQNPK